MIIDVHTHPPVSREPIPDDQVEWNTSWRRDRPVKTVATWDDYVQAVEEAGVDVSIVFNIAVETPGTQVGLPVDPARINDSVAEFVAADPAKRIGFLSVHPDNPGAMDELERSVSALGLKGIKLGPNYQDFDPLGKNAERIYVEAERRGLPILFHQGTSPIQGAPLRYAHPLLMDEIAMRHPDLRIVMAHMGHPWQIDTIVVIRKHPNVYADVSGVTLRELSMYQALRLATEWGVLPKLLFGSDFPIITPKETMDGLRRVNTILEGTKLPPVPLDEVEAIIHRDSLSLLGLAHG